MSGMHASPGTGNPDGKAPGTTHAKLRCPKCGDRFGQLPAHLVACDGGDSE